MKIDFNKINTMIQLFLIYNPDCTCNPFLDVPFECFFVSILYSYFIFNPSKCYKAFLITTSKNTNLKLSTSKQVDW